MKVYLVGGAVRDTLLKRPIIERDWVVVGGTEQQMLDLGYTRVGADFPVFLHPKTKEEYALARTERKRGHGYKGFECNASSEVTLEQDLLRRDLTVNAMAMDENGNIIDPYQGQVDLNRGVLRHVSDAFIEDPLRVFRVARFAARYKDHGFAVANQTLSLMKTISQSGELAHLSAERVWKETSRSLLEQHPDIYFSILKSVDALSHWFPELEKLWGIPNPSRWHPEIDTGLHTMMVLKQACRISDQLSVRFAALVHDFGKGLTDTTQWPSHRGHDDLGLPPIKELSKRLKVPNDCAELALLVSSHHSAVHRLSDQSPESVLNVLNKTDAWRKPERFKQLLDTCYADFAGRKNFALLEYPQREQWLNILNSCQKVTAKPFVSAGLKGADIKQAIDEQRLQRIKESGYLRCA
ncbi:multifunctional CCA addition/repair protein [Glaciecola sp. KUL10]|uniref:multifunctional CCA addition/repair protein n=1 Tax=Glaciecola sp. (strain KUL10) TaxID=2161813 RepID=UPI000D78550F|nr:multifunctional CCA addition/repair protein [Glaciecola sp. KUL10]GBL04817.1 polynucleotide adenylyltransferase/metal dependent phosphohydrolase [Glaciecola sp. KUL10]